MDAEITDTFNFSDIKEIFELKSKESFEFYLQSIFPDLSSYKDTMMLGVSKTKLIDFLKLPIFICEKLFILIKGKDEGKYISLENLKSWLSKLYFGNFDDTAEVIFNLYDFDQDGFIIKEDIKLLLSFLPLKSDKTKIEYKYQLESLEELDCILKEIFETKTELSLVDFKQIIKSKSDIYLQLLCFLYQKCPFQEKRIKISKTIHSSSSTNIVDVRKKLYNSAMSLGSKNSNDSIGKSSMYDSPKAKLKPDGDVLFRTPNVNTKFSPMRDFFANSPKHSPKDSPKVSPKSEKTNKSVEKIEKEKDVQVVQENQRRGSKFKKKITRKETFRDNNSAELSGLKGMVRHFNEVDLLCEENKDLQEDMRHKTIVRKKKLSFNSPDLYLQKLKTVKHEGINLKGLMLKSDEEEKTGLELIDFPEEVPEHDQKEIEKHILFESFVYRPAEKNHKDTPISNENKENYTLYKQWMVLIGEELYMYEDETKKNLIKMHNLSGSLIKENGILTFNSIDYFYFSIIFTNKTRTYMIPNKRIAKDWTFTLRKTLNYHNFFDHYEIIDDLDEGHFGLVKLGVHKSTGEKVAIKIIKKSKVSERNLGLVQTEIDILKICKHPCIVKFLDHFENSEYIFIVTEYFENGNLKKYLRRIDYKMNEKIASKIVIQVCTGLKYLHSYGIVHRDIKPENIMVAHTGANFFVKILDFGLSKILGAKEKASDGCGTLLYVAPEVISVKSYNHLVDVWSLGVMLYHMLSGDFPFNSNVNYSVNEQILKHSVSFFGGIWRQRSKSVMELIKSCLEKQNKDRISIDDILNSNWIKEMELEM